MKYEDDVQFFARRFYIAHGWADIWLLRRLREWWRTGSLSEPTATAERKQTAEGEK